MASMPGGDGFARSLKEHGRFGSVLLQAHPNVRHMESYRMGNFDQSVRKGAVRAPFLFFALCNSAVLPLSTTCGQTTRKIKNAPPILT